MNLLTKSPDEYLAIAVLLGVAAFIAGYVVGHSFGRHDAENYIRTLRDTLSVQARQIAKAERRKTQEVQPTRRLVR